MHMRSCCFANLNPFAVVVAVAIVIAKVPYCFESDSKVIEWQELKNGFLSFFFLCPYITFRLIRQIRNAM